METRRTDGDLPLGKIFAVLIEDLDAVVIAIVYKHTSRLDVDSHAVHVIHIAGPRFLTSVSRLPEIQKELPICIELRDARPVISVGDIESSVGQPRDERRAVEVARISARNVGGADRLQKLLA